MKIENYAMDMQAKSIESRSSTTTFTDELQVENGKRLEEMNSIEEEFAFLKKLQFEMINKLIELLSLNTNGQQPSAHECACRDANIDTELKSYESEAYMYRQVIINKERSVSQSLDVSMQGYVQSGDRKIELSMNLSFSSSYTEKISMQEINFYDPLVISMDGELPELDKLNFNFDIDMDGKSDQISMLQKGSGFLALDKNENGVIDDGFELFGTQNGNGFADLKRYDLDNNNWIDENDDIFDKLRIWNKTEEQDELIALGESGVGAIYLGQAKGDYDLRVDNEVQGRIKSSGMYLNEDGTSGLLSQIDLVKHHAKVQETSTPLIDLLRA